MEEATLSETEAAPYGRNANWLVALVCVCGPALVSLIPMAAAPALIAMARNFDAEANSQLFSQIVMTLPAAMLIAAAPLAGWLAPRVGQRIILLASLVLYVIGGAGVLAVQSKETLIFLRLVLGIGGGGLLTSCLGLIGDHFSGHEREKLLGYATSLSSLFAALALVFGGRLVDIGGWQTPFTLYLLGIPLLLLASATIHNRALPAREKKRAKVDTEIRHVWMYYLLLILLTLGMFTPAVQVAFVLQAKGIGSAQTIGSVIASTSIVAIFSAGAFGMLRRLFGLHGFLALNTLAMGSGILVIGIAGQVWHILFGCLLVGIGAGMSEPATASIIFRKTSPVAHAMAMGLIVSALNAGQFINPLAYAPLRTAFSASGSFVVVGTLLLATSVFIAVRNRADLFERN